MGDYTPCAKIEAMQQVASTASGRWYLMAVKNKDTMKEKETLSKPAECTGFNRESPCSCTVYDFNSAIAEPFVPEYNVTENSYNMMSGKYDAHQLNMKVVDNSSSIFHVSLMGAENTTMTVRILGSDDYQSFMIVHICVGEDPDANMDMWFLSRSPSMSDTIVDELKRVLARYDMTVDDMRVVVQSDCVYPPGQTQKSRRDKFRVF
ncbi:uncharacterized protein LOC129002637 [Macrosteles quadrilineatus]|uniref:uncharacterized protein LOC129002637 n=1 Tax=Macrosteles quadrilineatus TaxID=74068 RepID=UPI0023E0F0A8|nr:uncharacterized protein LOC129002637 [Macrosteles quadrilineatus]